MLTTLKKRVLPVIFHPYFGLILILLVSLGISIQNYTLPEYDFWEGHYKCYNNYVIFKQSFFHLLDHKNLYVLYPAEHADHFKYSPTFALFMGIFVWLPDLLGLFLWNFLNCFIFHKAVKSIKSLSERQYLFILAFVFLEMVVSTMASQSNLLVAGLLIFAFNKLEQGKPGEAALLIVAGTFIKLFAILAAVLFLFYPKKWPFALYMGLWTIVFLLAPLVIMPTGTLLEQYNHWLELLSKDHNNSTGTSVYTLIFTLFGYLNKNLILTCGFIVLLLPLLKLKYYSGYAFRLGYLSTILIWIVVFNHKGESPTYVIAMAGCAIWGAFTAPSFPLKIVLIFTWLFSSFIKSDVFPRSIKDALHLEFTNAVMPTLVFIIIVFSLLRSTNKVIPEGSKHLD